MTNKVVSLFFVQKRKKEEVYPRITRITLRRRKKEEEDP